MCLSPAPGVGFPLSGALVALPATVLGIRLRLERHAVVVLGLGLPHSHQYLTVMKPNSAAPLLRHLRQPVDLEG